MAMLAAAPFILTAMACLLVLSVSGGCGSVDDTDGHDPPPQSVEVGESNTTLPSPVAAPDPSLDTASQPVVDAPIKDQVIAELTSMPPYHDVDNLTQALFDADAGVRADAVEALGQHQADSAAFALTLALGSSDPALRLGAIDSLAEIGTPVAEAYLQRALLDQDRFVRMAAADALEELREDRPENVIDWK